MNPLDPLGARGLFGRLGASIKGLLGGLVLLVVAVGLQFWNEGRTVRRDATLAEGRAAVTAVDAAHVSPENETRLVHVSGEARADAPVVDEAFGISAPALALRRRVEMFQWQEKRDRRKETTSGGATREVVTYRYRSEWSDEAIDSSRFNDAGNHRNPGPLPFENQTWRASQVRIGGFALAPEAAREIGGWQGLAPDQIALPPNLAASFRVAGDWLSTSADPAQPQIGDVRVRFERVPEGPVSVVAMQRDASLVPWTSAAGADLLLVESGRSDAAAMFEAAAGRNATAAWALRGAGFVLAWIGFGVLFGPLSVVLGAMPVVGRVAGVGIAMVSAVLAALLSAVVIGSGWLWHRPWLLGLVVLAAVAGVVWLLRGRRSATVPPPPPVVSPPPPPPPA
jgi:hypothetical protein